MIFCQNSVVFLADEDTDGGIVAWRVEDVFGHDHVTAELER